MIDFNAIETKWQEKWFKARLYEAKKGKKKFFIHFAYPGISGYLHVGHMRGFAYADMIMRYMRMKGYSVCFPAGFHASGLPAVSLAKKVERNDKETMKYLRQNGCPEEIIKKLCDPLEVVKFFSEVYVNEYWKRFGFLIDYSRLMDTISLGYKKFIRWQFHKLKEKGLLTQKPHYAPFCPQCGPVAVDMSETDILEGGDAETLEFTVIKFEMDEYILPAATLRPETIFGVTNMWVNPKVEYVIVKVDNEQWILSKEGGEKLSKQLKNVEIIDQISGKKLIGKKCTVPLDRREVPILSASFANPHVATGIVMSVPAHAPYDYIALRDSQADINPIVIINVEGYIIPAKEIVERMKIKNQEEEDILDEATQKLYKEEFHRGVLNEHCGEYAGIKVSEIKDAVKNDLINRGSAILMREFSKRVVCRCGEDVVIKSIPDQWFIRYSDQELTEMSEIHAESMNIFPSEYKEELPKVLNWFGDRACIRRGKWLGTEFPFKEGWIIEPISDSTLYPAYYIISKYVNDGKISVEEMTNAFFDYIFLGRGKVKNKLWTEIRDDFLYWYPVDINLGGKEHKTVHFPVFIMNHVAIMEGMHWPQGIYVNWWITQKSGEKISKSKGGAEPIPNAAVKYGVDTMRLYYAHIASSFADIEWDRKAVEQYKKRLYKIYALQKELLKRRGTEKDIDGWLSASFNKEIHKIVEEMEKYELRKAANSIYFNLYNKFYWYLKRGGENAPLIKELLRKWIQSMVPFTPHIAEEMWEGMGGENFVSDASFPKKEEINVEALEKEALIIKTIEDISEIIKVTKIAPAHIYIYTAPQWKWKVVEKANKLEREKKLEIATLIKEILKENGLKKFSRHIPKYAQKVIKQMQKGERYAYLDELEYLNRAKEFIEEEFNTKISIYKSDENAPDPGGKKAFAEPLRPALYVK